MDGTDKDGQHRRLLRIAAIRFLNPAPLMWNFEHEPWASALASRYHVEWMMPSECASRLELPEDDPAAADIGLVPVAALATNPGLRIVPGCAIAAKSRVRSILLVRRASQPLEAISTVAADTSSRASLAYALTLFRQWWNADVRFVPHAPQLDAMLAAADAAILIGDPALHALEEAPERCARTGEELVYHDLAAEWIALTGLPWVSAVWAVRATALARADSSLDALAADFRTSRLRGQANIPALVWHWSLALALPADVVEHYLTRNIHYTLDAECLAGLRHFYALAAANGVLPAREIAMPAPEPKER